MTATRSTLGLLLASLFLMAGCAPPEIPPAEDVSKLLTTVLMDPTRSCQDLRDGFRLIYLPVVESPDQAGLDYQEHWVVSDNGNAVRAWHLPAKLNRGTVLLSIGASGDMACYLFVARLLVSNGWSVWMYEYQGFGRSEGEPALETIIADGESVMDYVLRVTRQKRVTLMGISLGSIPSVAIAVRRPEVVNAVILDSPVALSAELERFGLLLGGQVDELVDRLPAEVVSESIIAGLTQPALIFMGESDQVTPPQTVRMLYELAGGPKRLVTFPGLDHALGPYVDTALYTVALEEFLGDVWGK
jgi:pimeloyl-ACP methyl ester carboxylesterase